MRRSGSRFQCPICREHFAGPAAYGRHFASDTAQCLTIDEMRAAGLRLNDAGFWQVTDPPRPTIRETNIGAM